MLAGHEPARARGQRPHHEGSWFAEVQADRFTWSPLSRKNALAKKSGLLIARPASLMLSSKVGCNRRHTSLGGVAIAVISNIPALDGADWVGPEPIPTGFNSFRPFGLIPKGRAGNAVEVSFLLDASGICHHFRRPRQKTMKLEITLRRNQLQTVQRNPKRADHSLRTRMNRENHSTSPGLFPGKIKQLAEARGISRVLGAVQCQQDVAARLKTKSLRCILR